MKLTSKHIITNISEYFKSDDDKSLFINSYYNRINKENDNLLIKVSDNVNFKFTLASDVLYITDGDSNRCETNVYNFIKKKLENNITNYYPVGGYIFVGKEMIPIEHWWIYDSKESTFIDITPLENGNIWCYAGVINYDINDTILRAKSVWDIDFFKGGNVYSMYFK